MSTREKWAALLPIVQAFVNGEPVQRLDYDHRWKDTTSLRDMLCAKHRIRPPQIISGTWEQDYEFMEPGRINGPVATGTFRWKATEQDLPDWPTRHGYTLIGKPRFIPAAAVSPDQPDGDA